ncbi:hypothetical protein [Streptomyces sp. ISL-11]|uniref:hypothetical protein n=1 Tax=Streptomyces sp. ISL-11 TaxID=2819174 RepID=UPI0035AE89E9
MEQQATAPRTVPPVDVEQAEAALIEHYPRLVRLGYLVLPPSLGRNRRVLTAHALVQRALPRNRVGAAELAVPAPRGTDGSPSDPGYAYVRQRVLRSALEAGRPRGRWQLPRPGQLPPLLPQVWGLRLFPRSGGADELALDQALATLSGPGRAAYVLRALELSADRDVRLVLSAAGVEDPAGALAEADALRAPAGSRDASLLESMEFDPCSLQARPTDLMRRRQHTRAAIAALAAAVVCGTLLGLPGEGWGPSGAAAPPYAQNAAAQQALDPAKLTKVAPGAWKTADRSGFAAWPARGNRVADHDLLGRALAVWARPGRAVQVTATPGTPSGPAPGPAQLLYAGEVGQAAVVVLYDGLRVVRYAESRTGGNQGSAALDFARTDASDDGSASAVVVGRADSNVRYLTAPWVSAVTVRDLLKPRAAAQPLRLADDGVTDPTLSPAPTNDCRSWPALQMGRRLVTDLGELTPARLTTGAPGGPRDVNSAAALAGWGHTACHLQGMRSQGVRSVNAWPFATQPLPGGGSGEWTCARAETWRGPGSRVLTLFQGPGGRPGAPSASVTRAEDTPACGARDPHVLAGALWKSPAGAWYALAAGSPDVRSVEATGGVRGTAPGQVLALPAKPGVRTELSARLADGKKLTPLK